MRTRSGPAARYGAGAGLSVPTDAGRDDRGVARDAARDDRGVSTIEVVILAPVIILFILVLVGFGQLVDGRGAVDGAARDAARAGSLQRTLGDAMRQATEAAEADLANTCVSGTLDVTQTSSGFEPNTLFAVQVSCTIRGLDLHRTITSTASSPLDPYRRAGN